MDGALTKYPLGMDTEWIRRLLSLCFLFFFYLTFSISGCLFAPLNQKEFLGNLVYGYAPGCEYVMRIYKFSRMGISIWDWVWNWAGDEWMENCMFLNDGRMIDMRLLHIWGLHLKTEMKDKIQMIMGISYIGHREIL